MSGVEGLWSNVRVSTRVRARVRVNFRVRGRVRVTERGRVWVGKSGIGFHVYEKSILVYQASCRPKCLPDCLALGLSCHPWPN